MKFFFLMKRKLTTIAPKFTKEPSFAPGFLFLNVFIFLSWLLIYELVLTSKLLVTHAISCIMTPYTELSLCPEVYLNLHDFLTEFME